MKKDNYLLKTDECVFVKGGKGLRTAGSWGQKPLQDLTFCIYFGREIWFSSGSGKSQLIFIKKFEACGNDVSQASK